MQSCLSLNEEVNRAVNIIKQGGCILYPTDTIWGIGCDATNYEAIEKIYSIKQRPPDKAMICLVSDFKMLNQYVENIPEVAFDILKHAKKPVTIIYDNPIRVSENIVNKDNTLAIRVVRTGFANALIKKMRKPLVSTSANISGQPVPKNLKAIKSTLLERLDYVVNSPDKLTSTKPSTIIKLGNDGTVKIIRP